MQARRIVLATFGSLGDLHPYLAIALELQRRSHDVLIATLDRYEATVRAHGIGFAPMHPRESQIGTPERHIQALFDPKRGTEYLVRELVMPYVRQAYNDLALAAREADVLVTHPLALAGRLLAEKAGLPWVSTVLSPMSLLSAIDPPIFPNAPFLQGIRKLGVLPYRLAFRLARRLARGWERPLAELRTELGLPKAPPALLEGQFSPALNLALFSPQLAHPQSDWPKNTVLCGAARFDGAAPDEATRSALEHFLDAGEPPIVFTLGSSAFALAGDLWIWAVDAAKQLDRRVLLITGEASPELPWVKGAVAAFGFLPYSLAFPRAAAVVHQGGIGTLTQALASGRPQLVLPVAFDQPDNAARAVRLGVARSLPFRRLDATKLASELNTLLAGPYSERARSTAEAMSTENGAAQAAPLIAALSH